MKGRACERQRETGRQRERRENRQKEGQKKRKSKTGGQREIAVRRKGVKRGRKRRV